MEPFGPESDEQRGTPAINLSLPDDVVSQLDALAREENLDRLIEIAAVDAETFRQFTEFHYQQPIEEAQWVLQLLNEPKVARQPDVRCIETDPHDGGWLDRIKVNDVKQLVPSLAAAGLIGLGLSRRTLPGLLMAACGIGLLLRKHRFDRDSTKSSLGSDPSPMLPSTRQQMLERAGETRKKRQCVDCRELLGC